MSVTNIIKKVKLNQEWLSVNLGSHNDFFLIAIKGNKEKKDIIDPKDIIKVRFEIGIDSGAKNMPLTIQFVTLDFNDTTSSDANTNAITAFARLTNTPNQFYIRPVSIDTVEKTLTTGEVNITVNINAVDLGD